MPRRVQVLLIASILVLAFPATAVAGPESVDPGAGATSPTLLALIANDDVFSTADLSLLLAPAPAAPSTQSSSATQHYGPYPSTSPDSGTCGNDWATDTFDRHFTVRNHQGTITVVEQFKDGSFVTNAGASPGGCQGLPAGTVNAGIVGGMHGYFIIPLPAGETQTSTNPNCDGTGGTAPCTTTTFINTHFSPACYPAVCAVTTFFFHYSAGDQGLIQHEWKNASADRGGNSGDIRSANIP
jgi:hypothetical protein